MNYTNDITKKQIIELNRQGYSLSEIEQITKLPTIQVLTVILNK